MSPSVAGTLVRIRPKGPFVFLVVGGQRRRGLRTTYGNALKRAGIKGCRFHDLRHTVASHLIVSGVDLLTVK